MATKMQMAQLELTDGETPDSQRVAVLDEPHSVSLRFARIPEPGEGELRVKVKWVGICGSDLETFRGTRSPEFLSTPARLGHEVAGVVDKIGRGVTGIRAGDKVACRYVWGAFAQYIACRPFNVKVLPADFPMEEISLIEILPGVIHAAELAKIDQSKNVLVMGQGVSGLTLTQVLALCSPRSLVVTDLHDRKLELARSYGATRRYKVPSPDTPTMAVLGKDYPEGFDVVIPCLLEGDGMVDAVDCCAMGAKIVMYGCLGPCKRPLDFYKVHRKRLEITSTEPRRDIDMRRYFQEGVQMVLDGLVNTREMVTHRLPLSRIGEAFAVRDAGGPDTIHVLVDCEA